MTPEQALRSPDFLLDIDSLKEVIQELMKRNKRIIKFSRENLLIMASLRRELNKKNYFDENKKTEYMDKTEDVFNEIHEALDQIHNLVVGGGGILEISSKELDNPENSVRGNCIKLEMALEALYNCMYIHEYNEERTECAKSSTEKQSTAA
jgi:hypothetical protein